MQKHVLLATFFFSFILSTRAQNTSPFWSLAGNSNANSISKLGTTTADPLNVTTNNLTRLRINSDGKVGIGTSSPQQLFHVEGQTLLSIFVSTTAPSAISGSGLIGYMKASPTAAGQRLGYFLLGSRGGGENNYNAAGMAGYASSSWSSGSHPAYLTFETTPTGSTTRSERMRIDQNGYVGIGLTAPDYPLDVSNATAARVINATSNFSGTSDMTAIVASSVNAPGYGLGVQGFGGYMGLYGSALGSSYTGGVFGTYGTANGDAGAGGVTGLYGRAGGGKYAYGVFGAAEQASITNAAGYFQGNVYANSYLSLSDRKFKKDIKPVENALSSLLKLKPATYQFKADEYKGIGLAKEKQTGLIADEVKQVFPELVQKAVKPARYDEKDRTKLLEPEIEYEAVNYQGLIPVLIASVQEQQQTIADLQKQITALKALLVKNNADAANVSNAYLEPPVPNPSKGSALVRYGLPDNIASAKLTLVNQKGQTVKELTLTSRGAGQVNLNTVTLPSGVYTYILWVDGQQTVAKQLVVAQ